jgi:hypothetical protein
VSIAACDDSPEGSVIEFWTLASFLAPSAAVHHHGDDDGVADDADHYDGPGPQERDDRGGHDPPVLLGYKERDPAERQLWDMMTRETDVVHKCVGKQTGAGGLPGFGWGKEEGDKAFLALLYEHTENYALCPSLLAGAEPGVCTVQTACTGCITCNCTWASRECLGVG